MWLRLQLKVHPLEWHLESKQKPLDQKSQTQQFQRKTNIYLQTFYKQLQKQLKTSLAANILRLRKFLCSVAFWQDHRTWNGLYRPWSPRPAGKCTWMSSPPKGSCILCSFLANWDKMSSEPLSLRWRMVMDLIHQDASRNGESLEIKYAMEDLVEIIGDTKLEKNIFSWLLKLEIDKFQHLRHKYVTWQHWERRIGRWLPRWRVLAGLMSCNKKHPVHMKHHEPSNIKI